MLAELSVRLEVPTESAKILQALNDTVIDANPEQGDALTVAIMRSAQSIGIRLAPVELTSPEIWELLLDGFSIAAVQRSALNPASWVFSDIAARHSEVSKIDSKGKTSESISKSQLRKTVGRMESPLFFAAQPSLECQSIASNERPDRDDLHRVSNDHSHSDDHHTMKISPQRRMLRFLKFETRDIWSLVIFGLVVGVLDLATPLAVEQMVTTIGFASLTQPLVWLAILLFGILTLSAIIKGLQFFIVEILQRRIFVRIVGDLSERLPRLERAAAAKFGAAADDGT